MYKDKILSCIECGKEFILTAENQAMFAERGFQSDPLRCEECANNIKRIGRITIRNPQTGESECE